MRYVINRKLTPKQKKFADYYIESGNATESAIRAKYSKNTAGEIGYENLKKPHIAHYIDEKMKELASKRIMGATEALELLTSIARAEITEEVVVSGFDGVEKMSKIPDVRDRQRAAEELLKRYSLGNNQELRNKLLEAQINKTNAEVEKVSNTDDDKPIEIRISRKGDD